MPDEKTVDEVLSSMHDDKATVLKQQRRSIEKEIVERRLIAADTTLDIGSEITELKTELLNLQPPSEQDPDLTRKERHELAEETRELTREERDEQRDTWKDVQVLKREEREVERELLESQQRRRRVNDLLEQ